MNRTSPQESRTLDLEKLTPRQKEVLRLIARGETNGQIAERLGISLAGAKWHVSEIIGRLGVESREEAADVWREHRRLGRKVARLGGVLAVPKAGWMAVSAAALVAVAGVGVFVAVAMLPGDEVDSPAAETTPPVIDPTMGTPALVTPVPTRVVNIYPASAYTECPTNTDWIGGADPFCVNLWALSPALGWRLVVQFPRTGERFEYFLPPEATSFHPPHPDDLYRPLKLCEHGGDVIFESFIITADGESRGPGGGGSPSCRPQGGPER